MNNVSNIEQAIEQLDSAEAFLHFFEVPYDADFLRPRRVQLLRLFHGVLNRRPSPLSWQDYQEALRRAYCLLQKGVLASLNVPACATCKDCD